ncbi:MAG: hypothetical protein MUF43_13560, partial [Flavobacterium sp.]|nr:hypothetical protein [Flavobacterium sp.]
MKAQMSSNYYQNQLQGISIAKQILKEIITRGIQSLEENYYEQYRLIDFEVYYLPKLSRYFKYLYHKLNLHANKNPKSCIYTINKIYFNLNQLYDYLEEKQKSNPNLFYDPNIEKELNINWEKNKSNFLEEDKIFFQLYYNNFQYYNDLRYLSSYCITDSSYKEINFALGYWINMENGQLYIKKDYFEKVSHSSFSNFEQYQTNMLNIDKLYKVKESGVCEVKWNVNKQKEIYLHEGFFKKIVGLAQKNFELSIMNFKKFLLLSFLDDVFIDLISYDHAMLFGEDLVLIDSMGNQILIKD